MHWPVQASCCRCLIDLLVARTSCSSAAGAAAVAICECNPQGERHPSLRLGDNHQGENKAQGVRVNE